MKPAALPRDLLERLWRDPAARSRNRNYARFRDDPVYRTAVGHVRSLLSLRQDLVRYQGVVALCRLQARGEARLTYPIPALRLRRSVLLSEPELELLRSDPVWQHAELVVGESPTISCSRTE